MREASSLSIIKYLSLNGAIVRYYDPTGEKNEFKKMKNVKYYNKISDVCKGSDLVIIHTEWNEFKILNFKNLVKKKIFSVFDMRNIYSPLKMKKNNIDYHCIGR